MVAHSPAVDEFPVGGARVTPVYWWGGLGIAFLVLQIYVFGSWIRSDAFAPVDPGPDPLPSFQRHAITFFQTFNLLMMTGVLVWGVRAWRREGRATTAFLFCLAWIFTFWQDPLADYARLTFNYNAHLFNRGSWAEFIPGWVMPGGRYIPEPLLFNIGAYIGIIMVVAFGGTWVMRKAKQIWPRISTMGLLLVLFAFMILQDLVIEGAWVRLGLYQFTSTVHSWTLWAGKPYQFPIYNSIFWGVAPGVGAALYYFRDDKGHALIERGSEKIKNPFANAFMRTMAAAAVFNLAYLFYNASMTLVSLQVDPMPSYPSYIRSGICGQGTQYECPGPDVHVPLPGSGPLPPFTGRN